MASEYLKWKYRDVRPDTPVELTPKQRRANWWYYHKWFVLLGTAVVVTVIYLLARGLGLWEVKPDYQVAYVGASALPEDTVAALETALAELGTDCNADGRVVVRLNQYVMGGSSGEGGMYAYAGSAQLMADLDSCDSYFFLLEDPETFQKNYQVLRRLDGVLPADTDRDYKSCYLPWEACPTLRELSLGGYTETLLGQEMRGDSQEWLSKLSIARRGFWTDKTSRYPGSCDSLWDVLTRGSLQ